MEIVKIKIDNLINKRQLAIQMFGIVAAGIIGLIFMPISVKSVLFLIAGIYTAFILINNYIILDKLIDNNIKSLEVNK